MDGRDELFCRLLAERLDKKTIRYRHTLQQLDLSHSDFRICHVRNIHECGSKCHQSVGMSFAWYTPILLLVQSEPMDQVGIL